MGPGNDHELAIVRIVDRIALERNLQLSAVQEIITLLDFVMTNSDCEFLVRYVRWRMENPIYKPDGSPK